MDFAVLSSFVRKFLDETMEVTYEHKCLASGQDTNPCLERWQRARSNWAMFNKMCMDVKSIVRGTRQQGLVDRSAR